MNPGMTIVDGALWVAIPIAMLAGLMSFLSPWGVTLLVDGRYQEGTTGRDVYESQEVH